MNGMHELTARIIEQCRRCSLNNARGEEITYDDGSTVFKCDTCGKTMYLGEVEEAHLKSVQSKRDRERAQENRNRYQNEKFDEFSQKWEKGKKEGIGNLPDIDDAYNQIVNPLGEKQIDDGEVYDEVNIV